MTHQKNTGCRHMSAPSKTVSAFAPWEARILTVVHWVHPLSSLPGGRDIPMNILDFRKNIVICPLTVDSECITFNLRLWFLLERSTRSGLFKFRKWKFDEFGGTVKVMLLLSSQSSLEFCLL
jgi:hypothetical protein